MRRKRVLLICVGVAVAVAAVLGFLLWPRPQTRYEVVFLPHLNGVAAAAGAINDHGQIVSVAHGHQVQSRLCLWDPNSGMRDLGQGAVAGSLGHLQINNAGQIAWEVRDPNGSSRAFLLDSDGVRHTLHPPNGGEIHILDLNNRGRIVGYLWSAGGGRRAFLWDKTAGMQSPPVPAAESMATGINDLGQIVGSCSERLMSGSWTVFLWDPNTGVHDLGSPGPYPAIMCDINNQGFIVGRFDEKALSIRTREGPWRRLCPDKRAAVQIEGLTEANHILSVTHRQRSSLRLFSRRRDLDSYLWDPNDGFVEIARCLGRKDVIEFFATAINNEGQIVGSLRLRNEPSPLAVLLQPIPEHAAK